METSSPPIVEGAQISKSTIVLTVNPDTSRTAWTRYKSMRDSSNVKT